jgi:hypothetical protein
MGITCSRRARQAFAGAAFGGLVLLAAACGSSASSSTAPATSAPGTPAASPSAAATSPSAAAPSMSPTASAPAAQPLTPTYLAPGEDTNVTPLYVPSCESGCPLSGDGTAILSDMTWSTWTGSEAVGTGTYNLEGCNPNCARGTVYHVPVVVTFSQPVRSCSAGRIRYFWSRASFSFPKGLPPALQGQNAPQNPWTFASVIAASQQSCS